MEFYRFAPVSESEMNEYTPTKYQCTQCDKTEDHYHCGDCVKSGDLTHDSNTDHWHCCDKVITSKDNCAHCGEEYLPHLESSYYDYNKPLN